MEAQPVSLIITHYQQFNFLNSLLHYLCNNNWAYSCETIVVDDCSLDTEQLSSLSKAFPSVIILKTGVNSGPSVARNLGASKARGEYLQFLDADDWIAPTKILLQYQEAIREDFPCFICSDWARVDFDSTPCNPLNEVLFTPVIGNATPVFLIAGNNFIPLMSGLILKSAFVEVGGFKEDMRLIEDVNLNIRLFQQNAHFCLAKSVTPLFFYRSNNPRSLSNSNNVLFNKGVLLNYFETVCGLKIWSLEDEIVLKNVLWNVYKKASLTEDRPTLTKAISELKKHDNSYFLPEASYSLARFIGYFSFSYIYHYFTYSVIFIKRTFRRFLPGLFNLLKKAKF